MGGPPKKEVQQQQQTWGNLNDIFGTSKEASQAYGASGKGTLDQVTNYFKNILGSRQGAMEAEAPAINVAEQQADAAKKQQAQLGTARTGGTAAGNQQIEDQTRAQINNLVAGAAPGAAAGLAQIGQGEVDSMLRAMGIGTQASSTEGQLIGQDVNQQRQAAAQMWSSLISGAAGLAGAFLPTRGVPQAPIPSTVPSYKPDTTGGFG